MMKSKFQFLALRGPNKPLHVCCSFHYQPLLIKGVATDATFEVGKEENIRNRYNQVPHLTQNNVWESD